MNNRYQNIESEVATRNKVNQRIQELRVLFAGALTPFIGKKVIKHTPYIGWTAAARSVLDKVEAEALCRFNLEDKQIVSATTNLPLGCIGKYRLTYDIMGNSGYVWMRLDSSYSVGDHGCRYVEANLILAKLDGDILWEVVCESDSLRTDYKAEEIKDAVNKLSKLAEEQSAIRSEIREFHSFYQHIR